MSVIQVQELPWTRSRELSHSCRLFFIYLKLIVVKCFIWIYLFSWTDPLCCRTVPVNHVPALRSGYLTHIGWVMPVSPSFWKNSQVALSHLVQPEQPKLGQTSNCILEDSFSEDFEVKLISKMGFSQNLWKPSIVSWFSVGRYLLINTFSLDTTLE